jgi:hypothetical protein
LIATIGYQSSTISIKIIREFLISVAEHKKLIGSVSLKEVEDFHNLLLTFGYGQHEIARTTAAKLKSQMTTRSIVQLNQKIDSKKQRRLQCSIVIDELMANIANQTEYGKTDMYRGIAVSRFLSIYIARLVNSKSKQ